MEREDMTYAALLPSLACASSAWTRQTRLTESMNRIRIKMKVILRPYWSFAMTGFSEMNLSRRALSVTGVQTRNRRWGKQGALREQLALDSEGQRDNEDHEQGHL